jgi:hypothetical protein
MFCIVLNNALGRNHSIPLAEISRSGIQKDLALICRCQHRDRRARSRLASACENLVTIAGTPRHGLPIAARTPDSGPFQACCRPPSRLQSNHGSATPDSVQRPDQMLKASRLPRTPPWPPRREGARPTLSERQYQGATRPASSSQGLHHSRIGRGAGRKRGVSGHRKAFRQGTRALLRRRIGEAGRRTSAVTS